MSDVGSFLTILALAFHFLVNDYALLQHHEETYRKRGRWVMAGAVFVGWGVGALYTLPRNLSFALFALVAGAIIVNSFKEEFPDEKENHFGYFFIGTLVYATLISIGANTVGN